MKTGLIMALSLSLACISCSLKKDHTNADGTVSTSCIATTANDCEGQGSLQIQAIRNISAHVILPTYENLALQAQQLLASVNELANNPSQKQLEKAQQAWRQTRTPWESTESFLFGPVEALGIDPLIDTWPLNVLDMQGIMAHFNRIDAKLVHSQSTNVQGFHTIEYLLFGNGKAHIKTISEMTQKELDYLQATCAVLAEHTQQLADAWEKNWNPDDPSTAGYVTVIMNPGLQNQKYSSVKSVLFELLDGMSGIVNEVGNTKIASPMGESINSADTTKVESPFSHNSLSDFANNIRSVKAVYTGDYGDHKGLGLDVLVNSVDPTLAQQVSQQINLAIAKIEAIGGPNHVAFRDAILNPVGRARVQAAIDHLHFLKNLLEQKVRPALEKL